MATDLPTNEQILQVLREQLETRRKINEEMSKQASLSSQLQTSLEGVPTRDDITQSLRGMTGAIEDADEKARKAAKNQTKDNKQVVRSWRQLTVQVGKYTVSLGAAYKVAQQMGSAFTGTFGAGLQMFKSLISSAFALGKAILSIPFRVFNFFFKMAQKGGGGSGLREAYNEVRKTFGDLASNEGKAVISMAKGLLKESRNLAFGGRRVSNAFGRGRKGLAAAIKLSVEIMKEAGNALAILAPEFANLGSEVFKANKALGMSAETMMNIALQARQTGKDTKQAFNEVIKSISKLSKRLGTNVRFVTKIYSELKNNLEMFAYSTQEELEATTAAIVKLGIESKTVDKVAESFSTLDKAAEVAAKSAQLFGIQIDAVEMMKLADERPVDAMMKLRESMLASGKSFADLGRAGRKYYADMFGLDMGEMMKLMDPTTSMEDMQNAMEGGNNEAETQAEIMKKLGKSIDRLIGTMKQFGKSFTDIFLNGMFKGMRRGKNFKKIMHGMRASMYEVEKAGVRTGLSLDFLFSETGPYGNMMSALNDLIGKSGVIDNAFEAVGKSITNFFNNISTDPKNAIKNLGEDLEAGLTKALGPETIDKFKKGFIKLFNDIGNVFIEGLPYLATKISEGLDASTGFMQGGMGKQADTVGGAFTQMLGKVFAGLKKSANILWPHLRDTLEAIFELAKPYLIKALGIIFAVAIGKALIVGATSAAIGAASQTAIALLTKKFGKAAAASKLGSGIMGGGGGAATQAAATTTAISKTGASEGTISKAGKLLKSLVFKFLPRFLLFAAAIVGIIAISKKLSASQIAKGVVIIGATAGIVAGSVGLIKALQLMKEGEVKKAERGLLMITTFFGVFLILAAAFAGFLTGIQHMLDVDFVKVGAFMTLFSVFLGEVLVFLGAAALMAKFKDQLDKKAMTQAGIYIAAAAAFVGVVMLAVGKIIQHIGKTPIENPDSVKLALHATNQVINNAVKMLLSVTLSVKMMSKVTAAKGAIIKGLVIMGVLMLAIAKFANKVVPMMGSGITLEEAKKSKLVGEAMSMLVNNTLKIAIAAIPFGIMAVAGMPLGLIMGGGILLGMAALGKLMNDLAEMIPPMVKAMLDAVPNDSPAMLKAKSALLGTILGVFVELGKMISSISAAAPKKDKLFSSETLDVTPLVEAFNDFLCGDGTTQNPGLLNSIKHTVKEIVNATKGLSESEMKSAAAAAQVIEAVTSLVAGFSGPLQEFDATVVPGFFRDKVAETAGSKMAAYGTQMARLIAEAGDFIRTAFESVMDATKTIDDADVVIVGKKMDIVAKGATAISQIVTSMKAIPFSSGSQDVITAKVKAMSKTMFRIRLHLFGAFGSSEKPFEEFLKGVAKQAKHVRGVDKGHKALTRRLKLIQDITKEIAFAGSRAKYGQIDSMVTDIEAMISTINDVQDKLAEFGTATPLNVNTKLQKLGQALGVKQEKFTVQNDPIKVTLNLNVSMDVRDIAEPLVEGQYFFVDGTAEGNKNGARNFLRKNPDAFRSRVRR